MLFGNLEQDILYQIGIAAIGDTNRHLHPAARVVQHPVCHLSRDQLRVGNDHIGPVKGLNKRGADTDAFNIAFGASNHDPVAGFHRSLEQQNQTGNKVVNDILQTKTDTHGESTGDNCQVGKLHPGDAQCDEDGDSHTSIAAHRHQRLAGTTFHPASNQPAILQALAHPTAHRQQHRKHQDGNNNSCRNHIQ